MVTTLELIFAGLASVIHIYIFVLESVLWGKPKTNRVFNLSQEQAQANRLFAFNQGFYNLFLALAGAIGISMEICEKADGVGQALVIYACASMLAAAIVLFFSARNLRGAVIQGLAPLLALLFAALN